MTDKRQRTDKRRTTGAGAEGAEGIHSVDGGRAPGEKSGAGRATDGAEPGSEPLKHRKRNPKGSYGGEGGRPRNPPPDAEEEEPGGEA